MDGQKTSHTVWIHSDRRASVPVSQEQHDVGRQLMEGTAETVHCSNTNLDSGISTVAIRRTPANGLRLTQFTSHE